MEAISGELKLSCNDLKNLTPIEDELPKIDFTQVERDVELMMALIPKSADEWLTARAADHVAANLFKLCQLLFLRSGLSELSGCKN